jgi:non-ribosomal peptide synthetase component F
MMFTPPGRPIGESVPFTKETFEGSIPDRFEEIVRRFPERIAIKLQLTSVSYAQLNATANRLARTILAQRGAEPEAVSVLVGRGSAPAIAMLAVLKAGKYFVPLDPSFPKSRISATVEHSQAKLLVADRQNMALAREISQNLCGILEYESVDPLTPDEDLRLHISPSSLAGIVYTSGSTGEPKGVVLDHRALLHNGMRQGLVAA